MKNIFIVFVFSSLLFPQQIKSPSDTLKKPEKVVQETTDSEISVSNDTTKVEIVKNPETHWWQSPILIGFGGFILGWLLSFISQNRLIKKQLNYQKHSNRLKEFVDLLSEFIAMELFFRKNLFNLLYEIRKGNITADYEEEFNNVNSEISKKAVKIENFLEESDEDEKVILDLLGEYVTNFSNSAKQNADLEKIEKTMSDLALKINEEVRDTAAKKRIKLAKL